MEQTVLGTYMQRLFESGRTEDEIIEAMEGYYNSLTKKSHEDIHKLQEEIERQKAISREHEA